MVEPEVAGSTTTRRPLDPIEPVHWGARLVRAPGVVYTEVGGTPVLVRVDDAELQPMSPAWVSCWAALDGRPVADALDVDHATIDPITSRNLIEVLRRLKAKRLVADIDSLRPEERPAATTVFPAGQPSAGPTDAVLRGRLELSHSGPILTLPARPASFPAGDEVTDGPTDLVTVHLAEVDGSVTASIDGDALIVVTAPTTPVRATTPSGRAPALASDSTDVSSNVAIDGPDGDEERCIRALASILSALDDPVCLVEPGVVDLLAALAEQTQGHA